MGVRGRLNTKYYRGHPSLSYICNMYILYVHLWRKFSVVTSLLQMTIDLLSMHMNRLCAGIRKHSPH
jgi:hypothetical protein